MKQLNAFAIGGLALLCMTGSATSQIVDYGGARAPLVPGCPVGTSWTSNGARFICQAPPPPPPPPPPPVVDVPNPGGGNTPMDPVANCLAVAQSQGMYSISGQQVRASGFPGKTQYTWNAKGPLGPSGDSCQSIGNTYMLVCIVNPDNTIYQFSAINNGNIITCGGQGG